MRLLCSRRGDEAEASGTAFSRRRLRATLDLGVCQFLRIKESNMDDDDTFYDMDQPANDEDDADDDWGAWMLDNDTSIN